MVFDDLMFGLVELINAYAPRAVSRQIHLETVQPAWAESGAIDLERALFRNMAGEVVPVQAIGIEKPGGFVWAWGHSMLPDGLRSDLAQLQQMAESQDVPALAEVEVPLQPPEPGVLVSGAALAALAAGILGHAGMVRIPEQTGFLYLGLVDDTLLESPPQSPLQHLVTRYDAVMARSRLHPHRGGVRLTDPLGVVLALCQEFGVESLETPKGLALSDGIDDVIARPTADGVVLEAL